MPKIKRTTDEIIVLALCALCMMGLALFAYIRFQRGEYSVALLDTIGFVATVFVFFYVLKTQNLGFAGPFLAILSLAGSLVLVALQGPDERFLLYPTTVIAFFLMRPAWALAASTISIIVVSPFLLPELEVFTYGKFLLSISGCFLCAYIFARERNSQRDELLSLSTIDALTGVGNRRAFDEQVRELLRIQERNPGKVSLLFLDLDNFKEVNDTQGHDTGDVVLKDVAALIMGRMRAGDHPYRYGGDEFAVIAQGSGVSILADDLCRRIGEHAARQSLPISVSIGVAELVENETAISWIKRTDTALYEAKASGRSRVCLAG